MVLCDTTPIKGEAGSERLVVLVHGWCDHFSMFSISDVGETVREELPDADLMVPKYPSGIFSNTNLDDVCKELAEAIEKADEDRKKKGGRYQEIILIGFSLGSLIVRMTYLIGRGDLMVQLHGGVMKRYDWVDRVSRIILLAGNNRGWSMNPKPKKLRWQFYLMFILIFPLRVFGVCKLIASYRRGQPFVENLRIQWLRRERESPIPPTIQLYGEDEDLVSREDMLDQKYCANFILIDVPGTGHGYAGNFHEPGVGGRRRERFVLALRAPISKLRQQSQAHFIPLGASQPKELGNRNQRVKDVVFVIHGIRDWGDWTYKVSQCIDQIAKGILRSVNVIAPAYTRFPLLGFLLGPERRKKVEWFVNEYTRALAAHPDARFHFIGHSNGTYLLASALERYEMMRVNRVAFAGSVVRRDYPWDKLVAQKRVESVRNDRAVDDLVVAVFPRFFELVQEATGISLADVGGAGVFGFHDAAGRRDQVLLQGGHGAAIVPANHVSLARYVLGLDATPRLDESIKTADRVSTSTQWIATFSWLVWLGLVACPFLLALGLTYLWWFLTTQFNGQTGATFTEWLTGMTFPWGPILIPLCAVGVMIWWLLKIL
jgi:alpha-beta hydrolase superfamily lysophospholipase